MPIEGRQSMHEPKMGKDQSQSSGKGSATIQSASFRLLPKPSADEAGYAKAQSGVRELKEGVLLGTPDEHGHPLLRRYGRPVRQETSPKARAFAKELQQLDQQLQGSRVGDATRLRFYALLLLLVLFGALGSFVFRA